MKITHNKVGQNVNLSDTGRAEKAKGKAGAASNGPSDALRDVTGEKTDNDATRVNLSPRAQSIKQSKEIAMSAPDVREDRVAELQKMIDSGKYKVSASDIADKMVDEEAQWS